MSQKEVYLKNVDESHMRWMAQEDPHWLFQRNPYAVATYNPEWACKFVPNWMAEHYPQKMFELNKMWLIFKYPEIAYHFDAGAVILNNPFWMVTGNKTVCAYSYPVLLSEYSKNELAQIRPDAIGGIRISKFQSFIEKVKNAFGYGARNDRLPDHLAERFYKPKIATYTPDKNSVTGTHDM